MTVIFSNESRKSCGWFENTGFGKSPDHWVVPPEILVCALLMSRKTGFPFEFTVVQSDLAPKFVVFDLRTQSRTCAIAFQDSSRTDNKPARY